MKTGIHPTWYEDALVVCACGNTWHTGSTKKEIHTDVCSACHPFYTGEQRIVDTAGQVERFMKRVSAKEQLAPKPEAQAKPTKKERRARARGDMRSGVRGAPPPEPEAPEAPAETTETAVAPAEQRPEAIMTEESPAGRTGEPLKVEPVESHPAVESAAPVSESAAESEARTPQVEAGTAPEGVVAEAATGTAQPTPARPRTRPPRTSRPRGEGEQRQRPPRKPRAEKPTPPPAEMPSDASAPKPPEASVESSTGPSAEPPTPPAVENRAEPPSDVNAPAEGSTTE